MGGVVVPDDGVGVAASDDADVEHESPTVVSAVYVCVIVV